MGIAFGLAAIVILTALAAGKAKAAPALKGVPEFVQRVIADPNASRDDLLKAADAADEAGFPQLGAALRKRAETARKLIASPFKDVSGAAWTRFARVIAGRNRLGTVNPKGFYGLFQLGVRRLTDLDIMSDPKKQSDGSWTGTWVVPMEKFLSDPKLQYRAFAKSMELYRIVISEKFKKIIGAQIEGKSVTLSGLLAVAHMAGSQGLEKWLTSENVRKRFSHVTEMYLKANGVF